MKTKLTLILTLVASVSLSQVHKHVDSVAKNGTQLSPPLRMSGKTTPLLMFDTTKVLIIDTNQKGNLLLYHSSGTNVLFNPKRDTVPVFVLKVAHVDTIHNTMGSLQILGYDKISTLEFYSHANVIWIKAFAIREEQLATPDRWIIGEKIPMEFQTIGYLYADKKTPITENVYMSLGR